MFDRGAAVLQSLERRGRGGVYLCPLCLRAFCKVHGLEELLEEEHAPQKLLGDELAEARCLTCGDCNHAAGDDIERRTAPRIAARSANHSCAQHAPFEKSASGLLTPNRSVRGRSQYLALDQLYLPLQVRPEERFIELRSALLIAFAALGYTYVGGSGPNQLRQLLARNPDSLPSKTCVRLPVKGPHAVNDRQILVIDEPLPAVLVMHPSAHCTGGFHAVVLPPSVHDGDFYAEFLAASKYLTGLRAIEVHDWPQPRQLEMHWDVCDDPGHPRTSSCVGFSGELHYGWKHRDQQRAAA